jgi:hypothetical protein
VNRHLLILAALLTVMTAPAYAKNACSLLTQSEASKFLGTPVVFVGPDVKGDQTSCRYSNAAKSENILVEYNVTPDAAQAVTTIAKAHAPAVAGLSRAYWASGTVFALKGKALITIGMYRNADSMKKMDSGFPALARLVVNRY